MAKKKARSVKKVQKKPMKKSIPKKKRAEGAQAARARNPR